jgi:hypothetical protein
LDGVPDPARCGPQVAGTGFSRGDMPRGHGLPVGLTVPSIQLAHALELLNRRPHRTVPVPAGFHDPALEPDPFEAAGDFAYGDSDLGSDAEEARRLVADALASLAGSAGLSVPMGALARGPASAVVDPEVEAALVELDLARAAWKSLPPSVETWQPHPHVDRYFAAEDAVLNLADGSPEVLRRQAGLLLDLADEITEQMGAAAANAVANIAQGLLLRLRP